MRFSVRGFGCAPFCIGGRNMKQTINDLWRGELCPVEEPGENDEKIKEVYAAIEKYYNILWNKLDDDGKALLDKLRSAHTSISYLENEDSYAQGFSLALKLMTEALSE